MLFIGGCYIKFYFLTITSVKAVISTEKSIFHLSLNVYLLNLCHKHKWLQHFLYGFQNKSTPAFLLTESILLFKKGGIYC